MELRSRAKTGFVCKVQFSNDLPPVPFDPKFMKYPFSKDRFVKFQPMSLDRSAKAELHVEDDVGVPLDLFEALRHVGASTGSSSSSSSDATTTATRLDAADQALVDAYNASYNNKAGVKGGPNGSISRRGPGGSQKASIFRKTSAIRSKRGAAELKKQKAWMIKTRYLDNSFESSVSNVVTKNEEMRRAEAVRKAKLAKIKNNQAAKANLPASERVEEQFRAAKRITVDTAKHPNQPEKIHAVEVLDLLPDQTQWLHHHVTVLYTRKPFSKEAEKMSVRAGILQGIPESLEDEDVDEEDVSTRMMLIVPDNADSVAGSSSGGARDQDNVYRWKQDYVFELQPKPLGEKNMIIRQEKADGPFLYSVVNRRFKLNRAAASGGSGNGSSRAGAQVLVKRRRELIPVEREDREAKRRDLAPPMR
jgi:hypothetical protein